MNTDWLSLHIFYNQFPERMLVEAIQPLTKSLLEQGKIQKFFFIRYWMGGMHVRLRLALTPGVDREQVKALALKPLEAFLKRFPSRFKELEPEKALAGQQMLARAEYGQEMEIKLYPDNSIHEIPYQREWDRYAGPRGMLLSEDCFFYSSRLALQLLPDVNWHVRTILLGQAFQIMLVTTKAFQLPLIGQYYFYKYYVDFWIRFNDPNQSTTVAERRENLRLEFEKDTASHLEQYDKLLAGLAGQRKRREDDLMLWWYQKMSRIHQRAKQLNEAGALKIPATMPQTEDAAFHLLLQSYLHMTNNRLGAGPYDEVYLGYFCMRVIGEKLRAEGVDFEP